MEAVEIVFKNEGGWNPNEAESQGGCSNYGITLKTYSDWIGRQASCSELKNMPRGNATAIYKENYWAPVKGDQIKSQAVALAIFDQGVNRGPGSIIKQVQRVLQIYPSGNMDAPTLERLNNYPADKFLEAFLKESREQYDRIAHRNYGGTFGLSSFGKSILRGWNKRIDHLESETGSILRREGISSNLGKTSWTTYAMYGGIGVAALAASYFILSMDEGPSPSPTLA